MILFILLLCSVSIRSVYNANANSSYSILDMEDNKYNESSSNTGGMMSMLLSNSGSGSGSASGIGGIGGSDVFNFIRNPQTIDVVSGKNTTLECEVNHFINNEDGLITINNGTTSMIVTITWMQNGVPLVNTTRRYMRQMGFVSTLYVLRADRELDAGSFTCTAKYSNINTTISSLDAQINVLWIGEATVQLQTPESASYIKPNEEVVLRCHLDGTGDIKVKWFRNMEPVYESQHITIKKRRLHIKQATPVHNGIYKCQAENEAGSVMSISNFALAIPGDHTAIIEIIPKDQLVKEGESAHFDCVYKNSDILQWYYKKDGPLENTSKISVLSNGSLIVKDVNKFDEGVYSCIGMRGDSTEVPQTYTAVLKLAYLNDLTPKSFEPALPKHQMGIIAEGGDFQLTCLPPNGLPTPRTWWRSPHNHTISDSGTVRVDGTRLIITNAKYNHDSGNYTCVAENKAGITELSFLLVVTKPPIIIEHPRSVELNEGEPVEFNCDYEGTNTPNGVTITRWRKNGKVVLDDTQNGYRVRTFPYNGTLLINSVVGTDQGQYKCEVRTEAQASVFSNAATLSVIEKLKFSPPPVNKKLELGSVGKIHCKAQGGTSGSPTVRWIKIKHANKLKDIKIDSADSLPSHVDDVNGTLLFNSVQSEDAGMYTCIAKDGDELINATIKVEVVVAPKFSVEPKNPTEAVEGAAIMIHCVVEGDPKPTIQWDKNLRMNDFDHNRFEVMENGSLYIKEVRIEDENNYGCTAGNSAGLNRKETKLFVKPGDEYRADGSSENDGAMITKAVLITTSVAAAYMILVVGLMLWCRFRRRSRKLPLDIEDAKNETDETKDQTDDKAIIETTTCGPSESTATKKVSHSNGDAHKSDSADTAYSQSSNHSKRSKSNYDKLQISRECLKDIVHIGRGEFGDIMIAKLTASKRASVSEDSSEPQSVMVKSLIESKDDNTLAEFKRQIDLFNKKTHENVARLIGLSREIEPHYMILEYTDWGDLKRFLVATKKDNSEKNNPTPPPLSVVQIVSIALQLARGAEHIADQRLVHKDIAARNCLITSQLTAKISLAALTKDIYREEYCKHINQVIPLRWMPHEAVYEDDYSTKSDVWSWGCLVWELFHQGDLPFSDLSDTTVLTHLKDHTLKWKPHKATPPDLVELQESCWFENPNERPTFTTVVQKMTDIVSKL